MGVRQCRLVGRRVPGSGFCVRRTANKKAPHDGEAIRVNAAVKRFFLHFIRVINPESMLDARN